MLDGIAEKAGISRRTFFHYFKSKDDILLSLRDGVGDRIVTAVKSTDPDKRALDTLRERWPQPERQTGLRLIAMMSIGAMRIATEALGREGERRSYATLLNEVLDALDAEV